jgi:hypothetical protein
MTKRTASPLCRLPHAGVSACAGDAIMNHAPCADAELVAAGVEFRVLRDLFVKARRLSQPNRDAFEAAKRSGVLRGLEDEALFEQLKRIDEEFPVPVPCCDDVTEAMDPVFERIMSLPATTIEGLAVKADVVRHYYEKVFDDSFDAGAPWDDAGTVRALVEAVSTFAGRPS